MIHSNFKQQRQTTHLWYLNTINNAIFRSHSRVARNSGLESQSLLQNSGRELKLRQNLSSWQLPMQHIVDLNTN